MTIDQQTASTPQGNAWRTFGIVVITFVITLGAGYWAVTQYLFPTSFTPVVLSEKEQQHLDHKLERLSGVDSTRQNKTGNDIEPETYSEVGASREIHISEKELNAMLANSTDLANKLAIDLSDNLASAKLLVDLDPDFPFFGGKTLKVTAGMEIMLSNGKPSAVLKGVSVWGVPLPNAWLGNMKNTDLSKEFGQSGGLWQALNEGIEEIEVKHGELRIKLKE
jgi:hypothetical protein